MPKRVVFLAWAPFFSGAERALLLTVRHLDPSRYEPHVIVGTEGETANALREAGVGVTIAPLRHLTRRHPLAWAASVGAVLRTARRLGAALIHANDAPSFQPGGYAARWLRIPAATHIRFPSSDAGFRWFLRSGFTQALFVSDAMRADAMNAAPGLFEGRAEVLYDGVALPPPPGPGERERLRQSLGLATDVTVVALTGQIAEVKGIWDFVAAAQRLVQRGVEAQFAVLGDDLKGGGALREAMQRRVDALGLTSRFRFLGFRPDAPRLIPAFDIVAVPSLIEPLGNATLEAMAAGRPVVGSRVGGIPEMVVEGETGRLVPAQSPDALAEALAALVADRECRERLGAAGRARAERVFSLPVHGARLQAMYDALLAGRDRPVYHR